LLQLWFSVLESHCH